MVESNVPNFPKHIGEYSIERQLGVGGMGTVYLARSASGEARAIKVLHAELSGSQELRSRLEREAAVLKRLRGDRSAAVYEINATAERPYLVMEYVSGLSLDKHIAKYGKLSGVLVWAVMDALLEAAEMFHAEGVTHRDLKPSNVMLGEDGVKIIDFGISGLVGSSLTELGSTPATTLWSSPEQMNGAEVGQASDIFNLGMIFAYAWTGKHPFDAAKRDAVMLKLMTGEPNLAGVPSRLSQIVSDCLAKDPMQRPSAREVRDQLRLISRSSSNSDSGSRSGDLGSSLTGTVIVNVAEEIQKRPREQLRQGAALKNRQVIYTAAAIAAVLVLGVVIVSRGDGGQSVTETAPVASVSETSEVSAKPLSDFYDLPRSSGGGSAVTSPLIIDLTENDRFRNAGTAGKYRLSWFASRCKAKTKTTEQYPPIRAQLQSPLLAHGVEFVTTVAHIRDLLQEAGSPISLNFPVLAEEWLFTADPQLSPIFSSILNGPGAEGRNEMLSNQFELKVGEARPLRIVLTMLQANEVDALRNRHEDFLLETQAGLPSGVAVDYGWAVPYRRKTSFDPKEIDAAVVTFSAEHWLDRSIEDVLLTLARGVLLGLGSSVDAGPASLLSVAGGKFAATEYSFSDADLEIARGLGYSETGTC